MKPLPGAQRLTAAFALYNDADPEAVFKSKRYAALNPPVVEGLAALRDGAGEAARARLLRLIAAYRGW